MNLRGVEQTLSSNYFKLKALRIIFPQVLTLHVIRAEIAGIELLGRVELLRLIDISCILPSVMVNSDDQCLVPSFGDIR